MTARERQASGGATLAERPAPARTSAPGAERDPPSWEELARLLPTEQQQELLALAARQGVLFAHQLPAVDATLVQQRRQLLTQLVAGKAGSLPPLAFTPLDVFDVELDAAQREAVARAVATPELCLIQGLPGSGKSRVVAEIVRQAVARSERVLFVSATVTALDRVLEQLGPLDGLFALRGVHTSESRETLPACVRPLTLTERTRSLCETAVQQAQCAARQAEEQLQRRQNELKVWEEIAGLTETLEQTREKLLGVQARAAGLIGEVRAAWDTATAEAGSFAAKVLDAQRQHREQRDACNVERQKLLDEQGGPLKTETANVANQLTVVRPLVDAWRGGQWWSVAWWKVLFNKAVLQQFADLDKRSVELRQRGEQIAARLQQLDQNDKAGASAHEQRRQQLLDEETARRQAEVDHDAALLGAEAELLRQRWEQLAASLGTARPTEATLLAIVPARHQEQALLERDRQQADFTKRWADGLTEAAPVLAARLPTSANLVAATPAALGAEIAFAGLTFDLLIVDEADLIADPDLLLTARRARRWVLLGEPEPSRPRQGGSGRSPRTTTTVLPGAFHRLWHQLHVAPRQLPFRWTRNADRLCCRLRPVPDDQRHWVESEPVADRPEIELFILSVPRQDPVLVEVRFPAATPVRQAKEFILRELQEAAAHAVGPAYLWSVAGDLVCVQTGTYPPSAWDGHGIERVPLDEGVQEVIRSAAGEDEAVLETLGFTFDRPTWDRPRAEVWLAAHLGLKDSGRTAYLGRLHRPTRELGAFLADALFRDAIACTPLAGQNQRTPLPEVIPVPPLGRRDSRRPPDNIRRGGAGLEIDLAANPPADRLAPELRSALPRHGLVNHTEAVALVQSLEGLLSDPAFRKEAHGWQAGRLPAGCSTQVGPAQHCLNGVRSGLPHAPAVAVSALYEAQVQLLRLLVSRSSVLANLGLVHAGDGRFRLGEELELIVETPPVLRQRECHVLLLSLTRSHATRAVALGEHPVWLPLALTRAAQRLMLFADVGTLQRRSQWTSAVDHLDETAAGRERELVVQLLRGQPEMEVQPAAPPPLARPVRR